MYFVVLSTINPFNVYYYNLVEDWANDFFKDCPVPQTPGFLRIAPNRSYGNLDLCFTPLPLRQEIVRKLGPDHNVSKMLNHLPIYNDTAKIIDYVEFWDSKRNTNWKQTFFEIVKYYE